MKMNLISSRRRRCRRKGRIEEEDKDLEREKKDEKI